MLLWSKRQANDSIPIEALDAQDVVESSALNDSNARSAASC